MKPLLVLLIAFLVSLIAIKLVKGDWRLSLSGRIAMSAMLLFTSMGHFMFPQGMAMMLPAFIPYKENIIFVTGIIEIAAAIGLLIPRFKLITGWWLIVFFILILPANVYAAIQEVDYQRASYYGPGMDYLWFRVPLQILFIVWVYISSIRGSNQ